MPGPTANVLTIAMGVAVLLASAFGVTMGMAPLGEGAMARCPIMESPDAWCQMGIVEHVSRWGQLFTATAPPHPILLFVLLVALALIIWGRSPREIIDDGANRQGDVARSPRYPDLKTHHHLLLAFSDGILHPKIYEHAIL